MGIYSFNNKRPRTPPFQFLFHTCKTFSTEYANVKKKKPGEMLFYLENKHHKMSKLNREDNST